MQINLKVIEKTSLSIVDKIAIAYNNSFNSVDDATRTYKGFFTIPYNAYSDGEENHRNDIVTAYCDEIIDGKLHSYAWRWWGKRAEVLIEEMKK